MWFHWGEVGWRSFEQLDGSPRDEGRILGPIAPSKVAAFGAEDLQAALVITGSRVRRCSRHVGFVELRNRYITMPACCVERQTPPSFYAVQSRVSSHAQTFITTSAAQHRTPRYPDKPLYTTTALCNVYFFCLANSSRTLPPLARHQTSPPHLNILSHAAVGPSTAGLTSR